MTVLSFPRFRGINRALNTADLPVGAADAASNCLLRSGEIRPLRSDEASATNLPAVGRRSVYRYRPKGRALPDLWLSWAARGVRAVAGPLPDDAYDRVYWTGQGYPRMADYLAVTTGTGVDYPKRGYRLGVPAGPAGLTAVRNGALADGAQTFDTAYVYTLVTQFGEEGPPSPATGVVTFNKGQGITVSFPVIDATTVDNFDDYAFGPGSKKRLYRAAAGTETAAYLFVAEENLSDQAVVVDNRHALQLGEALPSLDWMRPPDDDAATFPTGPLQGLTSLPGGVLAGFSGRSVYLSEPYLPHAWPTAYRVAVDRDIVALGVTSAGLVVLTDGKPYVLSGSAPGSLAPVQVEFPQGCVNADSVVDMGGYLLYVSPDGLARIGGVEAELVSRAYLPAEQWNARFPGAKTSGCAFYWEGAYVFLGENAADSFLYDPDTEGFVGLDETCFGGWTDREDGRLYLTSAAAAALDQFASDANGERRLATWRCPPQRFAQLRSFGALYLSCDSPRRAGEYVELRIRSQFDVGRSVSYGIRLTLSEGSLTQFTTGEADFSGYTELMPLANLAGGAAPPWVFRLPPMPGYIWEVEVRSNLTVRGLHLADDPGEFSQVEG